MYQLVAPIIITNNCYNIQTASYLLLKLYFFTYYLKCHIVIHKPYIQYILIFLKWSIDFRLVNRIITRHILNSPKPLSVAQWPLLNTNVSHSVISYSMWSHGWSPPGSSVGGILQVRILEWVGILFSRGFSWPSDGPLVSCIAGRFFTIWATRDTPLNTRST